MLNKIPQVGCTESFNFSSTSFREGCNKKNYFHPHCVDKGGGGSSNVDKLERGGGPANVDFFLLFLIVFNRPGVAGAVLQSPPSLIH